MKLLTKRQADILWYIIDFCYELRYAPTLREIGIRFGIGSTNGVADHLKALEKKGYIVRDSGLSRAITVLKTPDGCSMRSQIEFSDVSRLLFRAGLNTDTLCQIKAIFDDA